MRTKESKRHVPHGFTAPAAHPALDNAAITDAEPTPFGGDIIEAHAPWEAHWIDLGGEG